MAIIRLDYQGNRMVGWISDMKGERLSKTPTYKMKIERHVEQLDNHQIFFKGTEYPTFQNIIEIFQSSSEKLGYEIEVTDELRHFISSKELHINSMYLAGNDIKKQRDCVKDSFHQFREIVSTNMSRQLRDKQMWDAFFMTSMKKSSNFSVPGSGKTSSVLGVYAYLKAQGRVNKIVVISPKNAFGSWVDEFNICFDGIEKARVFNIQDKQYKSKKMKRQVLGYDTGNVNLFLFNYEGLKDYVDILQEIVSSHCLLVYDEVHRIKSTTGKRAAHSLSIAEKANYIVAMTGTPIPNSYEDIYNLLHILYADEYKSFFNFSSTMLKNPRSSDIQLINEKMYPFFCRTNKNELNVPPPNDDVLLRVEASEAENRLFHILYRKYKGNLFSMFVRILQLESDPKFLLKNLDIQEFKKVIEEVEDAPYEMDYVDYSQEVVSLIKSIRQTTKTTRCLETVMKLVSEGKSVIVWCIFIESMDNLQRLLEEQGVRVMVIKGEVSLEDRQVIIQSFKAGEIKVLITNPHTLAESVSLHQVCHDAIYFEYSYNLVHLLQSKDRIHRLGLPEGQYTQYQYLMSEFIFEGDYYSLDEQIFNRLSEKEQTMLDAIDQNHLEIGTSSDDDLNKIFGHLLGYN
ncbi:MAG: DEAD/DEAH box helicase [Turicibacter sp.]|nr:DEAD/DEAH box helicase [Turicibacter sp.]